VDPCGSRSGKLKLDNLIHLFVDHVELRTHQRILRAFLFFYFHRVLPSILLPCFLYSFFSLSFLLTCIHVSLFSFSCPFFHSLIGPFFDCFLSFSTRTNLLLLRLIFLRPALFPPIYLTSILLPFTLVLHSFPYYICVDLSIYLSFCLYIFLSIYLAVYKYSYISI